MNVSPWFWGFCGAFIYAGPRWVIALGSAKDRGALAICTLDLMTCLAVGPMAAAAFGSMIGDLLLTHLAVRGDNAICSVIGLLANRVAPMIVSRSSSALDVAGRILKALRGDER